MKKPAAGAQAKTLVKKTTLKRPASSISSVVQSMQKGISPADMRDEQAIHESELDQDGRDKSKGQKCVKMRHQLPNYVVDLIEKESQKCASPREFKTACINHLFKRSSSGKLVLNLDDAMFTEHKKVYGKKYAGAKETALPELVMRGLYFANDQAAKDLAKEREEIMPAEVEHGKTFWSFTKFTKG